MSQPEDVPPAGLVGGKYRLVRLLGRGGMGSVWEGVHESLGTRVAIKFIDAEYADSPDARARFENEARAAARLRSKHVVQVYDHGVMDDGRPFIVMEFLIGQALDARLDSVGRLSLGETATLVVQIARALAKAHEAGIVHRDLKPENVFLVHDDEDDNDVAKVVDFGIAKFTEKNPGVSSSTKTGAVLGTPFYMSPEQARGLRSVDHRSDLWSVGVIAYRCLTGELPFQGEAVGDLLVKICTAPIPVPSLAAGTPPAFDPWFARALEREPERRFQSAQELAESMCHVAGLPSPFAPSSREPGVPSLRGPMSQPTPPAQPARTHAPTTSAVRAPGPSRAPMLAAVGLLALLVLGAGAWLAIGRGGGATAAAASDVAATPRSSATAQAVAPVVTPVAAASAEPAPEPAAAPAASAAEPVRAPVRGPARKPGPAAAPRVGPVHKDPDVGY